MYSSRLYVNGWLHVCNNVCSTHSHLGVDSVFQGGWDTRWSRRHLCRVLCGQQVTGDSTEWEKTCCSVQFRGIAAFVCAQYFDSWVFSPEGFKRTCLWTWVRRSWWIWASPSLATSSPSLSMQNWSTGRWGQTEVLIGPLMVCVVITLIGVH